MPIGVPKVAYRLPGDSLSQWIDLYNRLYRERVLFLGSDLDDELANQLVGIMVYLNAEDSEQNIFLYINSPGGSVTSGLAVFDTVNHIETVVHTFNIGLAASMASLVLAGGTRGSRMAFPNSRTMIHQPVGGASGQASDIMTEAKQILRIRKQIGILYSQTTGKPLNLIARDMDRDYFMSAQEASKYGEFGLVDIVVKAEMTNLDKFGPQAELSQISA